MGFADGFRTGEGLVNRYRAGVRADEEAALRKTEAARAEEQFGWQRTAQERLQKQNTELDGINQQLRGLPQGYNANTGQQAPDTSGADPTAWSSPEQRQNYGMQIAKPPTGATATELMRQAALVKGDYNASIALEDRSKSQKWDEAFSGALKEYTGAPEQIGPTARYLNQSQGPLMMGPPDKNGIVRVAIRQPDGEATFAKLSRAEQQQIFAATKLMGQDPQRALSVIAGVNKDLARAVAEESKLTLDVGKANNTATVQGAGIDNDNARLGLDKERLGIQRATAGAQIAADKARTPREMSPETVRGLNTLSTQISDAQSSGDMKRVQALTGQYNRLYSQAATEIGKVVPPREGGMQRTLTDREKPAWDALQKKLAELPDNAPQGQIAGLYARFGFDPKESGVQGMPAWGEAQAEPAAVPATQAPRGGLHPTASPVVRQYAERTNQAQQSKAAAEQDPDLQDMSARIMEARARRDSAAVRELLPQYTKLRQDRYGF